MSLFIYFPINLCVYFICLKQGQIQELILPQGGSFQVYSTILILHITIENDNFQQEYEDFKGGLVSLAKQDEIKALGLVVSWVCLKHLSDSQFSLRCMFIKHCNVCIFVLLR